MAEEMDVLETPEWIWEHIAAHGGRGWFFPIRVVTGHPLVEEPCFDCEERILTGDVAFVMPFHGEDGSKWIWQHKMCTARQMFGEHAEAMLVLGREHRRRILTGDSD